MNVWSIWHDKQILKTKNIKGDVMEFGVYGGTSFIATIDLMFKNNMFKDKRLLGFDSFKGLPNEKNGVEIKPEWIKGNYSCSKNNGVLRGINMYRKENQPDVPLDRIFLIEGWFKDSLTEELKREYDMESIAFAFIDVDLYISAKQVLIWLKDLCVSGTILCFDDWVEDPNMGEQKAFREFINDNPDFKFEEKHLSTTQHVVTIR